MKRSILIMFFAVLFLGVSLAQTEEPAVIERNNAIYLELLGNAGFYSLNYERIVYRKDQVNVFGRVGGSMLDSDERTYIIATELGMMTPGPKHFGEISLGKTYNLTGGDNALVIRIGYRYMNKKGFVFRFSPLVFFTDSSKSGPNGREGALALGYAF